MKDKNLLIVMLCIVVIVMAVAYAAFTSQLEVNGSASITSTWKVAFDQTGSSCTGDGNTVQITDDLTANLNVKLNNPKDTVTCTIQVKNTGTLDAKLSSIEATPQENDAPITYLVSPSTGDLAARPTLEKTNGTEVITVSITYDDVSEQPQNTTKTITVRANYVQKLSA